jgi:hypothetical protein
MVVWDAGTLSSVSSVLCTAVPESRVQSIGRITLEVKCAGARSAGNPHATCEVAGAGNGATETPRRARRGKPWIQTRRLLRTTAPVLDPTEVSCTFQHFNFPVICQFPVRESRGVSYLAETEVIKKKYSPLVPHCSSPPLNCDEQF